MYLQELHNRVDRLVTAIDDMAKYNATIGYCLNDPFRGDVLVALEDLGARVSDSVDLENGLIRLFYNYTHLEHFPNNKNMQNTRKELIGGLINKFTNDIMRRLKKSVMYGTQINIDKALRVIMGLKVIDFIELADGYTLVELEDGTLMKIDIDQEGGINMLIDNPVATQLEYRYWNNGFMTFKYTPRYS